MYSCPKCEELVAFDVYGEPICRCQRRKNRLALVAAVLGLCGMVVGIALVSCHPAASPPNPNSYCAHVDRANRGNCE